MKQDTTRGISSSDDQWMPWYKNHVSSDEVDPETIQSQIDDAIDARYHNHRNI